MKKTIAFLFLLLMSCKTPVKEVQPTIIVKEDTVRITLIKHLLDLRRELDHIETKDSVIASMLDRKKIAIDSMVDNTLDFKENKINLILTTRRYDKVVIEKEYLVKKVDSIRVENIKLYGENDALGEALSNQKTISSVLVKENKKLKTKVELASNVVISGVKVTGLGYTMGLFNKPKEYETNNSSKIRNIKFSCVIPPNGLAKAETKSVTFLMYGVDNTIYIKKDTVFTYTGKEEGVSFSIKTPNIVEKGKHRVVVKLNNVQHSEFFYNID